VFHPNWNWKKKNLCFTWANPFHNYPTPVPSVNFCVPPFEPSHLPSSGLGHLTPVLSRWSSFLQKHQVPSFNLPAVQSQGVLITELRDVSSWNERW
jgi:hypothetical protein